MTLDEARAWVEKIRGLADDDEAAHAEEDELHQAVLDHVARGGENAQGLAAIALSTRAIAFARWCA